MIGISHINRFIKTFIFWRMSSGIRVVIIHDIRNLHIILNIRIFKSYILGLYNHTFSLEFFQFWVLKSYKFSVVSCNGNRNTQSVKEFLEGKNGEG